MMSTGIPSITSGSSLPGSNTDFGSFLSTQITRQISPCVGGRVPLLKHVYMKSTLSICHVNNVSSPSPLSFQFDKAPTTGLIAYCSTSVAAPTQDIPSQALV